METISTSVGWQESRECEQQPPHLSILVHVGKYSTLGSASGDSFIVCSSGMQLAGFGLIAASKKIQFNFISFIALQ